MPMYAYRCEACGAEEEHLQKFSDPPIADCERCGGSLKKLLTPAAFHLKGGGWYKDGYASSKPETTSGSKPEGGNGAKSVDKGGDKGADKKGTGSTPGGSESASANRAKVVAN